MPSGIQSQAQILLLAEFCQRVTSSLLDYIGERRPLSPTALGEVSSLI